jgi:ribosomal protein L12E/L44/L45/RPP1/RPP2
VSVGSTVAAAAQASPDHSEAEHQEQAGKKQQVAEHEQKLAKQEEYGEDDCAERAQRKRLTDI